VVDVFALQDGLVDDAGFEDRSAHKPKSWPIEQVPDVVWMAGGEIVQSNDGNLAFKQDLGKVRADKAGAPRNQGLRPLPPSSIIGQESCLGRWDTR